jgi:hypothetical protein
MKIGHIIGLVAVGYFTLVGINEFLPTGTLGTTMDSLPDWSAATGASGATASGGNMLVGALDLGTAAAIYFFFLHGKL